MGSAVAPEYGECCGSREEGQANDIPATLVVVYYTDSTNFAVMLHLFFSAYGVARTLKQLRTSKEDY